MSSDRSEEPRWLDAQQAAAWTELVAVLIALPKALDAQLQRDAELSHYEYQVLSLLSTSPERSRYMAELAARTNGSASRLSHVVARLEHQGLVTRSPDPTNARFTRATLTEAGWAKVVETAPGHVEAVQHNVFDQLNPTQVRQLTSIARAINNATTSLPQQM